MPASVYRFGDFELDPFRFELRRNNQVLKLERIPLDLLLLLLEKEGQVVTRQEIVDRLWGKDVFVDTESGINTAIRKIRYVLRDDPEQPRFLQTVTGKGYRFLADHPRETLTEKPGRASSEHPPAMREPGIAKPTAEPGASSTPEPQVADTLLPAKRSRPWETATIVLAACVLLAALVALSLGRVRDRLFASSRAAQIHSIAVLPLANLSGDISQEYFADGMTDELITALAKNRSLRVVSRTSAMQYKGVQRPVRDIARELGVDGILEGSIARAAGRVHMTVQLIYARTDSHVWAESYDRDLSQAFSLPEELSQTVAKEVRTATSLAPPPRYINPDAHDAYLRGRALFLSDFINLENLKAARKYYEEAIRIQPDYAAAWSGLGDSIGVMGVGHVYPASAVSADMEAAARKGLQLDDSLPATHATMSGWYLFFGWDPQRALAESERAIALDPDYPDGHYLGAFVFLAVGRKHEAMQESKRYMEIDPFSWPETLGQAYLFVHEPDKAIEEFQLRLAIRPQLASLHSGLWEAYWLKGLYPQAQQELEASLRDRPEAAAAAHRAWVRGGENAVVRWSIEDIKMQARKRYVSPLDVATSYAYAHDKEETLKYLEKAYEVREPWLPLLRNDPLFDFLHSDPRYQAIVRKMKIAAL